MKSSILVSFIVLAIVPSYAEQSHVNNAVEGLTENQWRLEEDSERNFDKILPSQSPSKLEEFTREEGINDGQKLDISQVPYQVAIIKNSKFHCGGVLITTMHVLSVAICFRWGPLPNEYNVNLGSNDAMIPKVNAKVLSIKMHKHFDIALLKISKVKFGPNIKPILFLKNDDKLKSGTKVLLTGYGSTNPQSNDFGKLRGYNLTLISTEECANWTDQDFGNSIVCTRYSDGIGWSGTPLVIHIHGITLLLGLTSGSIAMEFSPMLYTNPSAFRNWIAMNL